jgi:hypothetical protein
MTINRIKRLLPPPTIALEWLVLGSVVICGDLAIQKVEHMKSSSSAVKTITPSQGQGDKSKPERNLISVQENTFAIDYKRMKGVAVTAFSFLVPIAVVWYPFLHRLMAKRFSHLAEGSFRYVMTKVALENIILPTPVCLGYFVISSAVEGGQQWTLLSHKLKTDFIPTVLTDTACWTLISPLNYKFVPLKFQPLFSCIMDGIQSAGLSYLTHHEDFKWPFM